MFLYVLAIKKATPMTASVINREKGFRLQRIIRMVCELLMLATENAEVERLTSIENKNTCFILWPG